MKMARKHNIINSLYLKPEELERTNFERFEKYEVIKNNEVMYESYMMDDAEYLQVKRERALWLRLVVHPITHVTLARDGR